MKNTLHLKKYILFEWELCFRSMFPAMYRIGLFDLWKASSCWEGFSHCLYVCTIKNSAWIQLIRLIGGLFCITPGWHTSLTIIMSWNWKITKDNPIKLIRQFCGLKYLNSPELLYNQLLIFCQMAWTLYAFQGMFHPYNSGIRFLRSPWERPTF